MHKQSGWKQSWQVCVDSFRKWRGDYRILSAFLLVCVFEWTKIQPVREYCAQMNLSISCWFYPVLFSTVMNAIFFYLGILLIFCNAPFVDAQQMYVILRSGSKNWFRGKVIYIFLASAVYFIFMYLVSILEFIPYVGFSADWESVMNSLSLVAPDEIHNIVVPREIVTGFSPIGAFLLCFMMNVLIAVMLGLLIFLINLYRGRTYGVGAALTLVLVTGFGNVMTVEQTHFFIRLSPVSWSDITVFTKDYGGVSIWYAVIFLCVLISFLVCVIMRRQKSYSIESMEEI